MHHHHAVKRVEARFDLTGFLITGFRAKLNNYRQRLVEFRRILRIFHTLKQHLVQIGQLYHDVLVDLDMPFLFHSLDAHHVHQVAIPLQHRRLCVLICGIVVNDALTHGFNVETACAEYVFKLPHIQQIFRYILFSKLLCREH